MQKEERGNKRIKKIHLLCSAIKGSFDLYPACPGGLLSV